MFKKCIAALAFTALFVVTAAAQDAKTIIANASKAMGADNLKTIQYSGSGTESSFGQAYDTRSGWPGFEVKTYTRTINFETPSWQIQRVNGEQPPDRRGGGNAGGANQVVIVNTNTPWGQLADYYSTPFGFLRAAASMNSTVRAQTIGGKKYNVVSFTAPSKAKVNGYINDQNIIDKIETWVDTNLTGDTLLETTFSNYKDFSGVKFPAKIVQKQGDWAILDLNVADAKPNVAANIQAPQGRGARGGEGGGGGGGGPQPTSSLKLAEGVFAISPSYASLAVEFKDFIVLFEAPQSEERTTAIINEAKKVIPNKPIRYVVNSHWHIDHSGGLRTAVAEGATIITHAMYKPWLEKALNTPHTLNPDKAEQAKKKVRIETMTEKKVITDGNQILELYHQQGNWHTAGMVFGYLPKSKVLVQADGFNPPAQAGAQAVSRHAPNLMDNIQRLKLNVETIVAVHYPADGRKVPFAELEQAVKAARPSN
jgi:glyoxylase-like metal-dependent hydrolase (beta-lactamase superfamily II)